MCPVKNSTTYTAIALKAKKAHNTICLYHGYHFSEVHLRDFHHVKERTGDISHKKYPHPAITIGLQKKAPQFPLRCKAKYQINFKINRSQKSTVERTLAERIQNVTYIKLLYYYFLFSHEIYTNKGQSNVSSGIKSFADCRITIFSLEEMPLLPANPVILI